jgi:hypothetical protein
MRLADGAQKASFTRRRQNQMKMVGDQAVGPAHDAIGRAALGQRIAIKRMITLPDENRQPPIATLGDMMRRAGNDDASDAGQEMIVAAGQLFCDFYYVTAIPTPLTGQEFGGKRNLHGIIEPNH